TAGTVTVIARARDTGRCPKRLAIRRWRPVVLTATVHATRAARNRSLPIIAAQARKRRPVSFIAAVLVLSACTGKESTAPQSGVVVAVTVAPATASVAVGQTVQLTATTKDAAGTVLTGRTVNWTSGNAGLAAVDGSG